MNKALVGAIVLLVAAIGLFGFISLTPFTSLPNATAKETAKIGVIVPLTGTQAEYGAGIMEGLELALSEINNDPKSKIKIELVYEDSAGDVKNSVSAAQKLISIDRAVALISGPSQHSMAVAPIAEEKHVVLLTMASQAKALATAGDYVFKNDDDLETMGKFAAEKIFGFGHRKAAVLFAEYNDATVDCKDGFVKRFSQLGGTVVAVEGYAKGERDYRTVLEKIKAAKPTVLFLNSIMGDPVNILKQANELGVDFEIFANGTVESQDVIDGVGQAAEGIVFVTFQGFPSQAFVEKTQERYGHYPKRWSIEAYDGLKILATALSKIEGEVTSEALQKKFAEIKSFDGESGHIEFDAEGNAKRQLFVKQIKDGKFVPFEE